MDMSKLAEKIKDIAINIKSKIKSFARFLANYYRGAKEKYGSLVNVAIISMTILIFLFGGYYYGLQKMSKSNVLNKIEKGFKNDDLSLIRSVARCDGKKIDKDDLKPLMRYYESSSSVDLLMKELKSSEDEDSVLSLKFKNSLFSQKYYLDIKKVNINVQVNFKGTKIYLDGIEKGKSSEDNDFVNIQDVIPGIYDITSENDSSFDYIKNQDIVAAMESVNNFKVVLKATRISIKSEYPDADVFINGKPTDIKCKDFQNQGLFDNSKKNVVVIKYEFPWGEVSSEPCEIGETPILNIKLNIKNDKLNEILYNKTDEVVQSIFDALNKENSNLIKSNNKSKIYNEFVQKKVILKNEYTLKDYDFQVEKSDVTRKDDYFIANIYVVLDYTVSKNIFGFNITSEHHQKKLFLSMNYKGSEWETNDVLIIEG